LVVARPAKVEQQFRAVDQAQSQVADPAPFPGGSAPEATRRVVTLVAQVKPEGLREAPPADSGQSVVRPVVNLQVDWAPWAAHPRLVAVLPMAADLVPKLGVEGLREFEPPRLRSWQLPKQSSTHKDFGTP
jgi:hypothetical protein